MTREEIESELPHFGGLHKRALSTALHYNKALASAISRLMVYREHHACPTCDDRADANIAAQRTLDAEPKRRAWEISDRCPECGGQSLFIGAGGWLTCSRLDCKQPAVEDSIKALRDRAERAEALWNEHTSANDCLRRVWEAEKRAEEAEMVAKTEKMMAEQAKSYHVGSVEAFKRAGFTMGEAVPEGQTLGPMLIDRLRVRAEQAEARAEKWKALAESAPRHARLVTTEAGYGIDWLRYLREVSALAESQAQTHSEERG